MEEVRAGAFRVLLRYLYTGELPEEEDCGEGLEVGEMAGVADRFQARGLYEHCVGQFGGGLRGGTWWSVWWRGGRGSWGIWRGRRWSSCVATWWRFRCVLSRDRTRVAIGTEAALRTHMQRLDVGIGCGSRRVWWLCNMR